MTLHFSTDVDTQTLERLEGFRAGGALYARIEGRLNLLYSSQRERQFDEPGVSLRETIASEPYELPAHQWCEQILPRLLPPGKFLVEVDCSAELGDEQPTRTQVVRARTAFYEARFEDMVAELYKLLEQTPMPTQADAPGRVWGSLRNVHKGVRELLNLYRHHNPEVPPLTRTLARFLLLAVMQSDVFRMPSAEEGGSPRIA